MDIVNAHTSHSNTDTALSDIIKQLKSQHDDYDLLIVYFNTDHNVSSIRLYLLEYFSCPIALSSSCQGALGINEIGANAKAQIVVFGISDPSGCYGVGIADVSSDNPRKAAQDALTQAISTSANPYETPALIWSIMPPGQEEELIQGFADIVGPNVPVFGGSSADNDVSGQWQQGSRTDIGTASVVVVTLQPSHAIGYSYSSGYEPTDTTLIAQYCSERVVAKFDGQTAAKRYNELTEGAIEHAILGGNVLGNTTLFPLGRAIPNTIGIPEYLLSHPDSVTTKGELTLFSHIDEGQELTLMTGSVEGLVQRASVVAKNAIDLLPDGSECAGVLMIYCGGCMLTIGDNVSQMQTFLAAFLPNIPICAAYTFGEQGAFLDGQNRHGNLMISAVAFAR
ncbi:FIST C-terminal domain-containing protein [Alteromonas sp. LMIT006]|jgi:hypothetical protein|uniref:FIST signal transduction protein n=1 Tax=Alteromonadaceae TaxID=72275 RepID=UPI0020CA34AE|nr:FIST C-terminal domain-containing protein [Alteromonas sp. LMIT006]UTP71843.1 FIST C-terminal domain-containing protein [Alteromonas sp. LMIT006]